MKRYMLFFLLSTHSLYSAQTESSRLYYSHDRAEIFVDSVLSGCITAALIVKRQYGLAIFTQSLITKTLIDKRSLFHGQARLERRLEDLENRSKFEEMNTDKKMVFPTIDNTVPNGHQLQ